MPARIGLFDSGVGGLSVWREVAAALPDATILYVADQAHVPYGGRPVAEVGAFTEAITQFLLAQTVEVVVLACNTASAAALRPMRQRFPQVPFVGVEPAVKPAAERTQTGVVGVLATELTAAGEPLAELIDRFANGIRTLTQPCPGLVDLVEAGAVDGPQTDVRLRQLLAPLVEAGIDQLVLGCTHYPFLQQAIERIVGPRVAIIDPAAAIARQVARVLKQHRPGQPERAFDARDSVRIGSGQSAGGGVQSDGYEPTDGPEAGERISTTRCRSARTPRPNTTSNTAFYTTGDAERFGELLARLIPELGQARPAVRRLTWEGAKVSLRAGAAA